MHAQFQQYYIPACTTDWSGRVDGESGEHLRWHQIISCIDLRETNSLDGAFVLLGFPCDEGVQRNLGRTGAAEAPAVLRKICANLPLQGDNNRRLIDAGNIICEDEQLEEAQQALGVAVSLILKHGGLPIILGGGHEVTYGHYLGLREAYNGKIGIINFDAHFDIRQSKENQATSGTGFYQIAQMEEYLHYLPIGIQRVSNTEALFQTMQQKQCTWIEAQDFNRENRQQIIEEIDMFLSQIDHLYMTIDMDVFASVYAPGVSAPAYNGIVPDNFFLHIFEKLIRSPKYRSIDFAELNPRYDIDNRTARLVADLVFRVMGK